MTIIEYLKAFLLAKYTIESRQNQEKIGGESLELLHDLRLWQIAIAPHCSRKVPHLAIP
jgi:hypothetical protein